MADRVERFDFIRMDARPKRTPHGFLKVRGRLTRVGVLDYYRGDGGVFRELRLPEEVFNADSLDSLRGAPVTVDHPGLVTSRNVGKVGVGHVSEDVRQDDRYIDGAMTIQRQDAVERVQKGELVELSPGYTCTVDATEGVWHGQKYDGIQRNIRYNHLALGPSGWGRSGPDVRVQMDSLDGGAAVSRMDATQLGGFLRYRLDMLDHPPADLAKALGLDGEDALAMFLDGFFRDANATAKAADLIDVPVATLQALDFSAPVGRQDGTAARKERKTMKTQITLGGVLYPVEIADELAPTFEQAAAAVTQDRQDALDAQTTAEADVVQLKADKAELEGKLEAATDPAAVEAAATARASLVQDAKQLKADIDPAGKGTKALQVEALVAAGHDKTRLDSADDAFIAGLFAGAVASAPAPAPAPAAGPSAVIPAPTETQAKADAEDTTPGGRRAAMVKRNSQAWTKPLN